MTKSELIELLSERQRHLGPSDVEMAVKTILEQMSETLASNERIEVRGFGSFSLHYRPPRTGRNPKTGAAVELPGKYVPHFKPGKELREKVNTSREQFMIQD
ncbi:MAG: integration host factor subunit beta [Thiothrix sp.]|nr:integration host factor subunit beta [Thiothrix sp.]